MVYQVEELGKQERGTKTQRNDLGERDRRHESEIKKTEKHYREKYSLERCGEQDPSAKNKPMLAEVRGRKVTFSNEKREAGEGRKLRAKNLLSEFEERAIIEEEAILKLKTSGHLNGDRKRQVQFLGNKETLRNA